MEAKGLTPLLYSPHLQVSLGWAEWVGGGGWGERWRDRVGTLMRRVGGRTVRSKARDE